MLLEDALQEYLYDCQLRKLSKRTMRSVKNNNLRFFRYLGNSFGISEVEKVKRVHVQSYVTCLSEQQKKETYVNNIIKNIRGLFVYCTLEEYIAVNPVEKIKHQKEEKTVILAFNNDEVRKMIAYYSGHTFLERRNNLIMVLLFDSGVRNTELCDVMMEDICENSIRIHGKGKKIRHVPLTPAINKSLIRYRRIRENYICDKYNYQTQYLFLSQNGKRLTPETIERVVRECGKACNVREELRCSPHTCRHYYAQTQLKNGCDLFTVSRLLGHSNINITKVYLNSINIEETMDIAQKTTPLANL